MKKSISKKLILVKKTFNTRTISGLNKTSRYVGKLKRLKYDVKLKWLDENSQKVMVIAKKWMDKTKYDKLKRGKK